MQRCCHGNGDSWHGVATARADATMLSWQWQWLAWHGMVMATVED
jgi:hypothetical protein